jgi:hypothetical protein
MDKIVLEEKPKKVSLFLHCITIIILGLLAFSNSNHSKDLTTLSLAISRHDPINT